MEKRDPLCSAYRYVNWRTVGRFLKNKKLKIELSYNPTTGGGHGNQLQYSCLENTHGHRTLMGCSPRGQKELDTTEATKHAALMIQLFYLSVFI